MDREEKTLSHAYDRGELKLENPSKDLLEVLAEVGENALKKDKRINSSHDPLVIQRKAVQEGIPCQALISGLIHQYVEDEPQETSR